MHTNPNVDTYISKLPEWQQTICKAVRSWIHEAEPEIVEEIKFTVRPYFTYKGNVAALLAAKEHVNVFIYDPVLADPHGIINQGHSNATARSIQIKRESLPDKNAFIELIRGVVAHNTAGGWRRL